MDNTKKVTEMEVSKPHLPVSMNDVHQGQILAEDDRELSPLPGLPGGERVQVPAEWNNTAVPFSIDRCIHQLFEAQVERDPDALAVVYQDISFTYRELNRRANQLAHYLQHHGVGPEVLVGLCVERSPEMIVGALGILKAGGVYVPLDPAYPPERLAFMLSDAQVAVLLTQDRLAANLSQEKLETFYLDRDWNKISEEQEENPTTSVTAENAAYIIYTSGSTGTPKGVVIEHRALVNYSEFAVVTYGLKPGDRVLQFAPLSFDTSAEEIYPCLVAGATLVLRTNTMIDSVSLFLQKCQDWEISVLDLPTAYWHELARKLDEEVITLPSSLRLVIIGGERVSPERVASWQKHVDQRVELVNTYGPTETTIVATVYKVPGKMQANTASREIPIGKPVANAQAYVLDQDLNPVPIGTPGELHIGGVGLARGYLNRPTLTEQKFIPHPFSNKPGDHLYKTGDRVRYLPTGDIEFLGRVDEQVKIRGFRVELGEVETVLEKHPDVREAVVLAPEDVSGGRRLVAYVVPQREHTLTTGTLRSFIQEHLPDYMIPAIFVFLESLPISPSGKVDRRALPAPEQTKTQLPESYVAPTLPVQKQLVQIWEELLHVRPIGIQDNFFELGGHSLLAVRLIDRIEQVWGKKISAATLVADPTIAALATVLTQAEATPATRQNGLRQEGRVKQSSSPDSPSKFSVRSALTKLIGRRGR